MDVKEGGVWVLAKPGKVTEESSVMPTLERRGKPRGMREEPRGKGFQYQDQESHICLAGLELLVSLPVPHQILLT